jgi:metallo-beta-lactamase class B
MGIMIKKLAIAAAMLALTLAFPRSSAAQSEAWTRPFEPFRMLGNIYWVGGYDLSTYLITTPEGHILINTGVGDTAQQIAASMEKLGFHIADVKILTATHGHVDHVAGLADLKRMSGATLLVEEADRDIVESGGKTDFRFKDTAAAQFPPAKVDRTFRDGDTISLGGTTLTAHHHPGHTKGATSFTMDVQEGGRTYHVIIANMPGINGGVTLTGGEFTYPGIADDYTRTFIAMKDLNIDVWLASHAGQFNMHEKYKPGDPYDPDRFVDPDGFLKAVQGLESRFAEQLAKERQK